MSKYFADNIEIKLRFPDSTITKGMQQ